MKTVTKIDKARGLLSFAGIVLLAWYEKWSATDLLWSLWITSLVTGYSLILASIAGNFIDQHRKLRNEKDPLSLPEIGQLASSVMFLVVIAVITGLTSVYTITFFFLFLLSTFIIFGLYQRGRGRWLFMPEKRTGVLTFFILLPSALFMLGFFSVHFLGFHFVHSIFLSGFFPLIQNNAGAVRLGTFAYFKELIMTSFKHYWLFILASAFSRLPAYRAAFHKTEMGSSVGFAYLNVVRMHILIFVIGFLAGAGLKGLVLYAVLFIFFFPFESFFRLKQPSSAPPVEEDRQNT